jgi:hypothetical protein
LLEPRTLRRQVAQLRDEIAMASAVILVARDLGQEVKRLGPMLKAGGAILRDVLEKMLGILPLVRVIERGGKVDLQLSQLFGGSPARPAG